MFKNVTEEQKSRSYFFICIVVGVGTIMILCVLLMKVAFDDHIEKYHSDSPKTAIINTADETGEEVDLMERNTVEEESVEDLFDEGTALEDEDLLIDDAGGLGDVQVDDLTL